VFSDVKSATPETVNGTSNVYQANFIGYYSQVFDFQIENIQNIKLYRAIESWLGTRYQFGGETTQGVDCSGFVAAVYDSAYGLQLPATSRDMYKSSEQKPLEKLKEGDLLFFKTRGNQVSHVGIYLGKNKFAHASTNSGVVISDLTAKYYQKVFYCGADFMNGSSHLSDLQTDRH
jgi:lipoprotein Spr